MKSTVKKIVAKPVEYKTISEKIRAKAIRPTVINGAIMLDPTNPSDRELWEDDKVGECCKWL